MLPTKRKELERTLERLSGKYEKDTAHVREYYADLRDIDRLVNERLIDPADGLQLAAAAKAKYDRACAEAKEQRQREAFYKASCDNIGWGYVLAGIFIALGWLLGSILFG
jgi:hypothetical protein